MGFGKKSLKLKKLMGVRNLGFCQKLSKDFFLSRTQMGRSLSDKNICIVLPTQLSDEILTGFRRLKKFARRNKCAHNIYTLDKEMLSSVQQAHLMYD